MRRLWRIALLVLLLLPAAATAQNTVVTDCTEAGLRAAIASGRTLTFNCASSPTTITIAAEIVLRSDSVSELTIDGGGKVILQGAGTNRIFSQQSWANTSSKLTLRNLTIRNGRAVGVAGAANGGAILSRNSSIDQANPPTLTLEQVTFTANQTTLRGYPTNEGLNSYDFGGGAIYTTGGYLTVVGCTFNENAANNAAGGAIHILQSSVTITNSIFSSNSAIGATPADSLGGAIYVDGMKDDAGQLAISTSSFRGNQSYNSGGAIYVNMYQNSNRFVVSESSFEENAIIGGERAQGGALGGGSSTFGPNSGNATISINRSYFGGNSVRKSGAVEDGSGGALSFPQRARISISESTFANNRAFGSSTNANGGAVYIINNSERFTITGSTFVGNRAGWVGGAISNGEIGGGPGGTITRSLFANNRADNGGNDWQIRQTCSETLANGGGNLQFPGFTANQFNKFNDRVCADGIRVADPQLAAPAQNGGPTLTAAFANTSPALDNGGNCVGTDQRGISRPQGAACDSGAFELVVQLQATPALLGPNDGGTTVTVTGSGFSSSSQIVWDGTLLPTTFVDSGTLRATLPANLGPPRTITVTVSGSSLPAASVQVVANLARLYIPLLRR